MVSTIKLYASHTTTSHSGYPPSPRVYFTPYVSCPMQHLVAVPPPPPHNRGLGSWGV